MADVPPFFLLIGKDTDYARLLEQHVSVVWDAGRLRFHDLVREGPVHEAFTAAAYDVVLIDQGPEEAVLGCDVAELAAREGFPPVVIFASGDAVEASPGQVYGVLPRERFGHARLALLLRAAVDLRREAVKLPRTRPVTLGRYRFGSVNIRGQRFVKELAAGGTARVYLAESERAGEIVVLKVFDEVPDVAERNVDYDRFLQEYEVLSRIEHPNVVRIHELGVADDHAYIAMEYFPCGDLRNRLLTPIFPADALKYLAQMAMALDAVHALDILHRDIKPGNVMLRPDDSLALIDFGLAKAGGFNVGGTLAGEIFGTPYYMSPEQGHGHPLDARSDLYSLGVIFYEMLTGRKPYLGTSPLNVIYMHKNAPIPQLKGELACFQPFLLRALAKEPADRFQSAREMLDALGEYG